MESSKQISERKKVGGGAEGAVSTAETKIIGAETFEELYDALQLIGVLREPDGREYGCSDIKKEIDRAREQLKTFNTEESRIVLTQEGFKNSPAYPLRNIPEIFGLKDKVSLLLRKGK